MNPKGLRPFPRGRSGYLLCEKFNARRDTVVFRRRVPRRRRRRVSRNGGESAAAAPRPRGRRAPDRQGSEISAAAEADARRYKQAAEAALEQLDFCINYLARMRRSALSARLAKSRNQIKHRLSE
jgi:hypothetical protein